MWWWWWACCCGGFVIYHGVGVVGNSGEGDGDNCECYGVNGSFFFERKHHDVLVT